LIASKTRGSEPCCSDIVSQHFGTGLPPNTDINELHVLLYTNHKVDQVRSVWFRDRPRSDEEVWCQCEDAHFSKELLFSVRLITSAERVRHVIIVGFFQVRSDECQLLNRIQRERLTDCWLRIPLAVGYSRLNAKCIPSMYVLGQCKPLFNNYSHFMVSTMGNKCINTTHSMFY